eukprot:TRINITY_DN3937_c0_g2_i1.p1 TRINITY_DN3937_c0_g2~~TRINITY_DN3937_c0_g2_i1.p1  ORF type:complete len:993 (-),score=180.57 TRINITY_DN3937_c0_g2_i1:228-2870(-)
MQVSEQLAQIWSPRPLASPTPQASSPSPLPPEIPLDAEDDEGKPALLDRVSQTLKAIEARRVGTCRQPRSLKCVSHATTVASASPSMSPSPEPTECSAPGPLCVWYAADRSATPSTRVCESPWPGAEVSPSASPSPWPPFDRSCSPASAFDRSETPFSRESSSSPAPRPHSTSAVSTSARLQQGRLRPLRPHQRVNPREVGLINLLPLEMFEMSWEQELQQRMQERLQHSLPDHDAAGQAMSQVWLERAVDTAALPSAPLTRIEDEPENERSFTEERAPSKIDIECAVSDLAKGQYQREGNESDSKTTIVHVRMNSPDLQQPLQNAQGHETGANTPRMPYSFPGASGRPGPNIQAFQRLTSDDTQSDYTVSERMAMMNEACLPFNFQISGVTIDDCRYSSNAGGADNEDAHEGDMRQDQATEGEGGKDEDEAQAYESKEGQHDDDGEEGDGEADSADGTGEDDHELQLAWQALMGRMSTARTDNGDNEREHGAVVDGHAHLSANAEEDDLEREQDERHSIEQGDHDQEPVFQDLIQQTPCELINEEDVIGYKLQVKEVHDELAYEQGVEVDHIAESDAEIKRDETQHCQSEQNETQQETHMDAIKEERDNAEYVKSEFWSRMNQPQTRKKISWTPNSRSNSKSAAAGERLSLKSALMKGRIDQPGSPQNRRRTSTDPSQGEDEDEDFGTYSVLGDLVDLASEMATPSVSVGASPRSLNATPAARRQLSEGDAKTRMLEAIAQAEEELERQQEAEAAAAAAKKPQRPGANPKLTYRDLEIEEVANAPRFPASGRCRNQMMNGIFAAASPHSASFSFEASSSLDQRKKSPPRTTTLFVKEAPAWKRRARPRAEAWWPTPDARQKLGWQLGRELPSVLLVAPT